MSYYPTASLISTPEERAEWFLLLKEQIELGKRQEAAVRAMPDATAYGASVDRGHQLDQAMSRWEIAEMAIQYLSGENIPLEDLYMLDTYIGAHG